MLMPLRGAGHMHEEWPPEVDRNLETPPEKSRRRPMALPSEGERERSPTLQGNLCKGGGAEVMHKSMSVKSTSQRPATGEPK